MDFSLSIFCVCVWGNIDFILQARFGPMAIFLNKKKISMFIRLCVFTPARQSLVVLMHFFSLKKMGNGIVISKCGASRFFAFMDTFFFHPFAAVVGYDRLLSPLLPHPKSSSWSFFFYSYLISNQTGFFLCVCVSCLVWGNWLFLCDLVF